MSLPLVEPSTRPHMARSAHSILANAARLFERHGRPAHEVSHFVILANLVQRDRAQFFRAAEASLKGLQK